MYLPVSSSEANPPDPSKKSKKVKKVDKKRKGKSSSRVAPRRASFKRGHGHGKRVAPEPEDEPVERRPALRRLPPLSPMPDSDDASAVGDEPSAHEEPDHEEPDHEEPEESDLEEPDHGESGDDAEPDPEASISFLHVFAGMWTIKFLYKSIRRNNKLK